MRTYIDAIIERKSIVITTYDGGDLHILDVKEGYIVTTGSLD